MDVYGELPNKYPVCVYDLWYLDEEAYAKANITGHKLVPANEVQDGDLFEVHFLAGGGYGIYHDSWSPIPDNTWVEVTHTAVPSELSGSWAWRTRGSGIWYNTGRTKVFPTPANMAE